MKRNIYKIVSFCLVLALYSCGEPANETSVVEVANTAANDNLIEITQAQFDQKKMVLGSLEEKSFPIVVSANGMIDVPPENRAVVSATMGGYIKTTPLLIGDTVKKGQVLVTLENPEFVRLQQEYMEVNEQLTYLKSEYERQISLKAENITSQKSYLQAESLYKTALAKHTGLEKQLSMLNISPAQVRMGNINSVVSIYAPISGSITKVNITKGSYVSPASVILEIIDTDHIHLELSVFEKDIMKIKKGQKIDFSIPEASSDVFKAEVHLVGTSISANRTIKVHGHIDDDSENNFLTGMFVNATIITDSAFAKALPSDAIAEVDGTSYVLVLDKKEGDTYSFHQEEVQVEGSYKGYTRLKNSNLLTPETQFLTRGAFSLISE
jgi:cobalt-zinc-cadmium efflux system membrane fusion protein